MRNKAKIFSIALVLVIAAILIFVFYSKSPKTKAASNFRDDYLKISMKAIQTNPELVTVSKTDKNGEFKDITAKFYIDYITDIQEGKFDKALKLLSDEDNYSIYFESGHTDLKPLLVEFRDGYEKTGIIGRILQHIREAKEQNLKPIKLSEEEQAIRNFAHVVFNFNYKDRYTKYIDNKDKYYEQFKDVATKNCIEMMKLEHFPYEIEEIYGADKKSSVFIKVKPGPGGDYIAISYQLRDGTVYKMTQIFEAKCKKVNGKMLVDEFQELSTVWNEL